MNLFLKTSCLLVLAGTLLGCSDSSSRNQTQRPDPAVDFTTFVKDEIDNTADTREAASITNQEFSFNDQNNEQAFDELFVE